MMEKLKIKQTMEDGLIVLIRNPVIFIPAFFIALLAAGSEKMMMMNFSIKYGIIWFFIMLVNLFLGAVIIRFVYDVRKRQPSWNAIIKFVLSKYVSILIATGTLYVVLLFGFIALIIPGVFLMIKLMFCEHSILLDNKGIIDSLKRSWEITRGNWWRLLALDLILVAPILISVISSIWLPENIYAIVYFLALLFIGPWVISSLTFAYLQLKEMEVTIIGDK